MHQTFTRSKARPTLTGFQVHRARVRVLCADGSLLRWARRSRASFRASRSMAEDDDPAGSSSGRHRQATEHGSRAVSLAGCLENQIGSCARQSGGRACSTASGPSDRRGREYRILQARGNPPRSGARWRQRIAYRQRETRTLSRQPGTANRDGPQERAMVVRVPQGEAVPATGREMSLKRADLAGQYRSH